MENQQKPITYLDLYGLSDFAVWMMLLWAASRVAEDWFETLMLGIFVFLVYVLGTIWIAVRHLSLRPTGPQWLTLIVCSLGALGLGAFVISLWLTALAFGTGLLVWWNPANHYRFNHDLVRFLVDKVGGIYIPWAVRALKHLVIMIVLGGLFVCIANALIKNDTARLIVDAVIILLVGINQYDAWQSEIANSS